MSLFSSLVCLILYWYCKEKFYPSHSCWVKWFKSSWRSVQLPHTIFFKKAKSATITFYTMTKLYNLELRNLFFWAILSKSELFTFIDITLVFHWEDLTLPVQTPHPSQARFKFPINQTWTTVKMPMGCLVWGGGGILLKLPTDQHITLKLPRVSNMYNVTPPYNISTLSRKQVLRILKLIR